MCDDISRHEFYYLIDHDLQKLWIGSFSGDLFGVYSQYCSYWKGRK